MRYQPAARLIEHVHKQQLSLEAITKALRSRMQDAA
jgi:hypothetical protein